MSISKKQICLKLNHNTTAHIFVGDLFAQSGIIIIPVNEYFDTLVGENVVSEDTLHGKFINQYFANNISELDNKMNLALSNIIFEIDDERPIGKNKKYPLGTTIEIKKDDKTFFLVALTNFNENNRASVSKSKYQEVLAKLFDFIEQFSQGKIVNLPLIGGSNRAGLDISLQKRLECIILTALFRNQLSLGTLNIVLTEKTLKGINGNKKSPYKYCIAISKPKVISPARRTNAKIKYGFATACELYFIFSPILQLLVAIHWHLL